MGTQVFLSVKEVSKILGMSIPYSYKVVAKLNEQLEQEGYMVIPGKISKAYFQEKFYGLAEQEEENASIQRS